MEYAIVMLATGALCIGCFFVGAKVGQKVSKGEEINLPTFNPVEAIREAYTRHEARQEAQAVQNKYDTIWRNIENYDGTSSGQEDVPKG